VNPSFTPSLVFLNDDKPWKWGANGLSAGLYPFITITSQMKRRAYIY
jgi:hypothetical protein